jgi:UDP-glucose 4-epimerase
MTVLVSGGAGYIGSHVVKALLGCGRSVVVVDNLYNGFRQSVGGAPLVIGDVADEELIRRTCDAYSVTDAIHFAALKSVGESMEQPHRYYEKNIGGTVSFTRALMGSGVKRLVFSSSASVYGTPAQMPVTESSPRNPESVYAATKAVMEEYFRFCEPLGLSTVSLRYFNAAGASSDTTVGEDWSTTHNLIPRMMRALLADAQPLSLYGIDYPTPDGTCIRDYIHVEDLAEAHIRALDFLSRGNRSIAINVGTGQGSSVREVIAMVEEVSGLTVPVVETDRRPGDPPAVYADPSLAKTLLGWEARNGLREIVESSYRWHLKFPSGYCPPI